MNDPEQPVKRHILTVNVEDYFHVGAFEGAVRRKHWTRFESRLDRNVDKVLELLDRHDATATFFTLGWVAERQPELVQRIAAAGHEIASRGYWPGRKHNLLPEEFVEELARSKSALEAAGSNVIVGFRASRWVRKEDLWILDVLADEGFRYDASINPVLRSFAWDRRRYRVHRHRATASGLTIWEFPISTVNLAGVRVAISGGNYTRQLPHSLLRRAVEWWDQTEEDPLVFYLMPWELDPDEPRVEAISWLNKLRHYRNLGKTAWVLDEFLTRYRFQSIGEYLELPVRRAGQRPKPLERPVEAVERRGPSRAAQRQLEPVTLVVPLYNEEQNISYLHRTLTELRQRYSERYRVYLCLVDDGSTDGTWDALHAAFGNMRDCELLRHGANVGVAGAILTGIQHAPTEIVFSIDCDCSYDPNEMGQMLPLIQDADLVTASPYHPQGDVFNVPGWRLFLSRTLSRIYSALLNDSLHTYTSCCRVYRKSVVRELGLEYGGFLGIAEMLIKLRLRNARVVEYPATLEARLFGESKMKLATTIRGHLKLLTDLWRGRYGALPSAGGRPAEQHAGAA